MFLAPIFLAGLTAVTVPVIIHLMHSPRAGHPVPHPPFP